LAAAAAKANILNSSSIARLRHILTQSEVAALAVLAVLVATAAALVALA
jgi:hypothetical protein